MSAEGGRGGVAEKLGLSLRTNDGIKRLFYRETFDNTVEVNHRVTVFKNGVPNEPYEY